jgi:predicted lipoprotein with Yx(FWY)xxD motif
MHHVALDVASSRFGQVLVDGQGRVVYLFAADRTTESTCYDACATAWPPLLTEKGAQVDAMHAATAGLTGTTTRKDGSVQVTYNGHPLYYFQADKNPGQITCQAVVNFGAAWYVVDPSGNAITKAG